MAINPQIPLSGNASLMPGISALSTGLEQRRQRQAQQVESADRKVLRDLQVKKIKGDLAESGQLLPIKQAAVDSALVIPMLSAGRVPDALAFVDSRIQYLESNDLDATHTRQFRSLIESNPQEAVEIAQKNIQIGGMFGFLDLPGSKTDVAQKTDLINGKLFVGIDDQRQTFAQYAGTNEVITGPRALEIIDKEMKAERDADLKAKKAAADISVQEAIDKGLVKTRQEALDAAGESARVANRSRQPLGAAKQLAEAASLGQTGRVKQIAATLFPDIDVSNEAALESALTEIALANLQNFKGPTTDFEFGVAERVSGRLSDGRSAVVAKVNAALRDAWTKERYAEQLSKWMEENPRKNPATFKFDYNEKIRIKDKDFKLQDLLDTARHHHLTMEEIIERFAQ